MPILVCTGLELVSALHAGKTNYPPFTGYNAIDNIESFVKVFFPIHARGIPRLMWEGIRNGIDHLFIPNEMLCGQNHINFTFVLSDSSQITKDGNNNITIIINSIEFCLTLRKAIDGYGNKLRIDEVLQLNFIKAWESINPKDINLDLQKSAEVQRLSKELNQVNIISLFK